MKLVIFFPVVLSWALTAQDALRLRDDPEARASYDAMISALRAAETLSFSCSHVWTVAGDVLSESTYDVRLKKPNRFRNETARTSGRAGGVIIGDGDDMWIHWPNGKPHFHTEDEAARGDKTKKYMRGRTPVGMHSIGHKFQLLGAGMVMPIVNPSTFHGYTDSLQPHLDHVTSKGTEDVRGELCDIVHVSFMKAQRTWTLWLSRKDHLPRRLRQDLKLRRSQVVEEEWTEIEIDEPLSDDLFVWAPPEGHRRWFLPSHKDRLLKPGTEAPDFELKLGSGGTLKLSDLRGEVVWLNIWRAG